jgi:hypothetical protein
MTRATSRSAHLRRSGLLLAALAAHTHGATPLADAPQSPGPPPPTAPAATLPAAATVPAGCLPGERGYFQATLRGALSGLVDWRGAALNCQGGERSQARGVRLSLQGTAPGGDRLRINIGIAAAPGASPREPVPASVTVIVEGAQRIFATGDDTHCAVEALRQERLPTELSASGANAWRVAARGYCIDPLPALQAAGGAAGERLYLERFDFAAIAHFDLESPHAESVAH